MKQARRRAWFGTFVVLAGLLISCLPAMAGTVTWTGGGGSGLWADENNWDTYAVPVTGDDVVLPAAVAAAYVVDCTTGITLNSLVINDGATLNMVGGTLGSLEINGGTLYYGNANLNVAIMLISGGTVTGSGTIFVTSSCTWAGGTLQGVVDPLAPGTLDIAAVATLSLAVAPQSPLLNAFILLNRGTAALDLDGANLTLSNDATIQNQGSFAIADDSGFVLSVGSNNIIKNTGSFLKAGGTGYSLMPPFSNDGGVLEVQSGTLLFVYPLVNGVGGLLRGNGTIDVAGTTFTNQGDIAPGTSPGVLTINGDLPLAAGSEVAIEIGGTLPGSNPNNHDRLTVSDTATLAGTLRVSLVGGFTPVLGNAFQVIVYGARVGTFATVSLPTLGTGLGWQTAIGTGDVTLTVVIVDSDGDGLADNVDPCPYDPGNDADNDLVCVADGDCDDHDATVYRDAPELCDSKDNDCDPATGDGEGEDWYNQVSACGLGSCAATGLLTCVDGGQIDTCVPGAPLENPETSCGDGIDQDCDGTDLSCFLHNIFASAGSGGTIEPSGMVWVEDGQAISFTITPAVGYSIAEILVDNLPVTPAAVYTFAAVSGDHVITASFVMSSPPAPPTPAPGSEDGVRFDADVTEVHLGLGPYSDADGDAHVRTYWRIRRADMGYYHPDYDPSFTAAVDSGDLNGYTVQGLAAGLSYAWQVRYEDASGLLSDWSSESTFVIGRSVADSQVRVLPGSTEAEFRMVSFVQWPDEPSSVGVLGDEMGVYDPRYFRFGAYDPASGGYQTFGPELKIVPGRAYWLLARNGLEVTANGVMVSTDHDLEVPLTYADGNGWNMIGAPNNLAYDWQQVQVVVYSVSGAIIFGPTPVADLAGDNQYLDTRLWRWEAGGYLDDTQLISPYQGYWVKARQDLISLRFPVVVQTAWSFPRFMPGVAVRQGAAWLRRNLMPGPAIAGPDDAPPRPPSDLTMAAEDTGNCFIATAAYGSYLAPEVVHLRRFRDRYLLTNPLGRGLVGLYYDASPPLAAHIATHAGWRLLARVLLTPLVYLLAYPLGFMAAMGGLLLVCLGRRHHGR